MLKRAGETSSAVFGVYRSEILDLRMVESATIFRAANACMFVMFMAGAAVQLNDPDPEVWILAYASAALVCAAAALDMRGHREHVVRGSAAALGTVIATAITVIRPALLGARKYGVSFAAMEQVEEFRELVGLCILAAWLFFVFETCANPHSADSSAAADPKPLLQSPLAKRFPSLAPLQASVGTIISVAAPVALGLAWYTWASWLQAGELHGLPEHCTGIMGGSADASSHPAGVTAAGVGAEL